MKTKFFLLVVAATVIFSCREKKQVDTEPPVVASFKINGSSDSEQVYAASSSLDFSASFTDNSGLKQITFNIHPAEDGHTHTGGGSEGGEDRLNSGNWSFSESFNVAGTTYSGGWQLQIPDSIAGVWHAEVTATDNMGQKATRALSIKVTNSNLPEIIVTETSPVIASDGIIYLANGQTLKVSGHATDPNGIAEVTIRLMNSSGTTVSTVNVPVLSNDFIFGPVNFINSQTGNYRVVIEVKNDLGYRAVWDARVKVQ